MSEMNIGDIAEYVCKKLPGRWGISLTLENGSGDLMLIDPDGNIEELAADKPLQARIMDAVEYAREHDGEFHV
jgi:hypothetical protein